VRVQYDGIGRSPIVGREEVVASDVLSRQSIHPTVPTRQRIPLTKYE